ncbi:MAG: hypothetical protein ACHBN1_32635 [Heteroscytonema crispum UTEX LB 1556]
MLAIFFICLWVLIMMGFLCSALVALKQGASQVQRLHQIPCYKCDFFTNDPHLKCTVNPITACTEEALGCRDFEPKTLKCNASQKIRRKLR